MTTKEQIAPTEIYRVAQGLSQTFIQRWDIHAQQQEDGRYLCHYEPLTMEYVVNHLRGELTLGAYVLNEANRSRYVVFDADDDAKFESLKSIAYNLPSYLETSRRGGHLWMFFEEPVAGTVAKSFGQGILQHFNVGEMEVFPKQGASDGPGSLVRLPFGVHRKTGKRYPYILPDGSYLGNWKVQMLELMNPKKITSKMVEKFVPREEKSKNPSVAESEFLWDRVKAEVPLLAFVRNFVELKDTSSGAVGKCPFHDDQHPSFSVNANGNYWNCFAGCGGGSIIDFWMKYRKIDFTTAVKDLATLLEIEGR